MRRKAHPTPSSSKKGPFEPPGVHMNAETPADAPARSAYPPSDRTERRRLNPFFRFLIIAAFGVLVAGATFYLMRKIGY